MELSEICFRDLMFPAEVDRPAARPLVLTWGHEVGGGGRNWRRQSPWTGVPPPPAASRTGLGHMTPMTAPSEAFTQSRGEGQARGSPLAHHPPKPEPAWPPSVPLPQPQGRAVALPSLRRPPAPLALATGQRTAPSHASHHDLPLPWLRPPGPAPAIR